MKKIVLFSTVAILTIVGYLFYYFNVNKILELKNEEIIKIHCKKLPFFIEKDKIFVLSKINNYAKKLIFDTGATQNIVFDSLSFKQDRITNKRLFEASNISTPDGVNLKSNIGLLKFENEILTGNPLACFNVKKNKFICTSFDGFFSLSSFIDEEKIIGINFNKNEIEVLQNIDTKLFAEVPFELSIAGKIQIQLKIQNKETWATFDTGFDGTLVSSKAFKNKVFKVYQTKQNQSFAVNKSVKIKEIKIFKNVEISILNKKYLLDVICNNDYKGDNVNMGLNFIKNFNWIFDFKNEKAYFQPISKTTSFSKEYYKYSCIIQSNKLFIGFKEKDFNDFKLDEQILAINSVVVDNNNICFYKDLLNDSKDWSIFKIVTNCN